MNWARGIGGCLAILIGLVWIGQGFNILRGSGMSGHPFFAVLGLVMALAGAWLLWSLARSARLRHI